MPQMWKIQPYTTIKSVETYLDSRKITRMNIRKLKMDRTVMRVSIFRYKKWNLFTIQSTFFDCDENILGQLPISLESWEEIQKHWLMKSVTTYFLRLLNDKKQCGSSGSRFFQPSTFWGWEAIRELKQYFLLGTDYADFAGLFILIRELRVICA